MSLPVQGAWIEILCTLYISAPTPPSLPVQGAWIEIRRMGFLRRGRRSLPVQGAWIEIRDVILRQQPVVVAPRAGSVD